MKRAAWLLGLAAGWSTLAGAAHAEDWALSGFSHEGVVYETDLDTVARTGGIAKTWVRMSGPKPFHSARAGKTYAQSVSEYFNDCENHRLQIGVYVDRDASGETVETGSYLSHGWEDIVPGSVAESAWKLACALTTPLKDKPLLEDIGQGNWSDLGPSADGRYHLSVRLDDVVKLEGGYVAALMRTEYVKPTWIGGFAIRYVITGEAIDCASGKSATLGGDFYLSRKARVAASRTPSDKLDFHALRPGSFIANGLKLICASARTEQADEGAGGGPQGGYSVGTAWGVNKGYLVTASHVIEGGHRIWVYDNGRKVGEAKLVADDPANDLAVLKFTPAKPGRIRVLPIAPKTAALGRSVFVLGYPAPDALGQRIKMTAGQVSSTAGYQDDARYLQISVPLQEGNSGGPVIAWDGTVVGVVEAKLTRFDERKAEPAPEMVNYALKASYVRPMLEDLPDLANYTVVKPLADHERMVAEARQAVFIVVVAR